VVTHMPSGRVAHFVHSTDIVAAVSGAALDDKFVLVALSEGHLRGLTTKQARICVEQGASYICAWGHDCEDLEETFDYAAFLPELGPELSFTLMTTSHRDQPLEDALEFGFRWAQPPDDFPFALNRVVLVADSNELVNRCTQWVASENA
jgi:2-methylisocitrate lyase-like PEP mutase family enzyme